MWKVMLYCGHRNIAYVSEFEAKETAQRAVKAWEGPKHIGFYFLKVSR